ncbi:hypothetical protein [uncultured Alsobacter sp.]|uniref:hypothetical protein n=1 Tax=uncultured Alsobacter sp. TaxID=1748258 RepID=UPI0025FBFE22|nr:hypothetical protein [uncultured Alsobacter sp.]
MSIVAGRGLMGRTLAMAAAAAALSLGSAGMPEKFRGAIRPAAKRSKAKCRGNGYWLHPTKGWRGGRKDAR